jgi:hypothetical protein
MSVMNLMQDANPAFGNPSSARFLRTLDGMK